MFNIKDYLEKFSKSIHSSEDQKRQIIEIIKKHTQIDISPDNIEIKNYTVYLKTSPGVSNKIFINKEKILGEISSSAPSLKIVDIR